MASPYQVRPCDADRALLRARVRAGNTPQKMVLRALIVLMAADGASNATIAEELGVCGDTARKVARVKAWGGELPAEHGLPLSRWSAPELARQLLADGIGVSVATVRRW